MVLSKKENIDNRAVIGLGYIDGKGVEPYAIVVRNSSELEAKKFSDLVIEELEATQWWSSNKQTLIKGRELLKKK